jgi:transcriptional regulator with XRE-family HTH domain
MGRREKLVTAEPNTIESLGATLRRARQQRSISLSELAQRLGYSKSHLSVVETGRVWPSRELLQAYEAALDLKGSSLVQLADSLAPLRRSRPSAPHLGPLVETLLTRLARGVGERPKREVRERSKKPLPANGASTRDARRAVEWACALVEWAATHRPAPLRDEIIVVGFRLADAAPTVTDAGASFQAALQGALNNGWNVSQLRWVDGSDDERLAEFASMLEFYGFPGAYRPFALPLTKGLGTPPYGLVAVPGHGALLWLPTRTDRLGQYAVYAALVFTDLEAAAVVWENGAALRERSQALATAYQRPLDWRSAATPDPEWLQFSEAETRTIVQPGDRLLVRDGLGTPALFADGRAESELIAGKASPEWEAFLRTLDSDRILQQTAFRDQTRLHQFRDLVTKRGLERFADGEPSPVEAAHPPLSGEQRAAWLRSLASLLQSLPNYEIGLLDDAPRWLAPGGGWVVKGGGADGFVQFETTARHEAHPKQLLIEVRDPVLVQAMREYFLRLWEGVPHSNREKPAVVDYLNQLSHRAANSR